jgi:hypothetical protein
MSLIQYQQTTYAVQLRDQLELAGCEARVATLVSRAVGDLIDHVSHVGSDMRRDMEMRRRDLLDRFIRVAVLVMAVAVVSGVLTALFL